MGERRLSKRKLVAIVDALTNLLAGEWDEDSRFANADFDGALEWASERLARYEDHPNA